MVSPSLTVSPSRSIRGEPMTGIDCAVPVRLLTIAAAASANCPVNPIPSAKNSANIFFMFAPSINVAVLVRLEFSRSYYTRIGEYDAILSNATGGEFVAPRKSNSCSGWKSAICPDQCPTPTLAKRPSAKSTKKPTGRLALVVASRLTTRLEAQASFTNTRTVLSSTTLNTSGAPLVPICVAKWRAHGALHGGWIAIFGAGYATPQSHTATMRRK